jgi:NAD(P)-dependent dehydrogenase (short-subunit alcohol dehydrogenase family)
MFSLSQKKAVITGGASGIGKAVSTLFACSGAEVHVVDLHEQSAAATMEEIRRQGGIARAHRCDVSDHHEVMEVFADIGAHHIVVNCAGVSHIGRADNTSPGDIDRLFAINVKGVYNTLFACIPRMKANGGGVILNVASIAAWVGLRDRFAYSMTKGAVAAMTLSVARDYISDGIRCNSISPARVHTPFVDGFIAKNYPGREKEMFDQLSRSQPIGRMATPEEVAGLALYLCSDAAAFITGCDYPVDGGFLRLNTI